MTFSQDHINTLENLIYKNKTKSISIYLVLVLAIIVFLFLLPIIKADISSQSRGVIRSNTDNVPVTTIVNGRIIWLKLKNNIAVNKGDTLIKISKESLITETKTQDTLSDSVQMLFTDISDLLLNRVSQLKTSTAREELHKYQSRRNELQSKVAQSQINFNRNKGLYDKDIIATSEYEKYLYDLRLSKEALQSFESQQKSTWENQKRDLEEKIKNINGSISKIKVESKNYVVIAPISGTIEGFSGLQNGSFITASQVIATISPFGSTNCRKHGFAQRYRIDKEKPSRKIPNRCVQLQPMGITRRESDRY